MCERKPSPKTVLSILALVLALAVVSGCGSTNSKPADAAPTAESETRTDEVAEHGEGEVHAPARPRADFVTSCAHHLNATTSLCRCFQEKVQAHETHVQVLALEANMRENVPLPAAVIGYVEECQG